MFIFLIDKVRCIGNRLDAFLTDDFLQTGDRFSELILPVKVTVGDLNIDPGLYSGSSFIRDANLTSYFSRPSVRLTRIVVSQMLYMWLAMRSIIHVYVFVSASTEF